MSRRAPRLFAAAAALAVLAVLAVAPPSAQAQLLAPADAEELAQSLAEAAEEQGVCYGWLVRIDDENSNSIDDAGSSQGPGRPLDRSKCQRYVELVGLVDYTSEMSEAEDSASYEIQSNLGKPPTTSELNELGYGPERLLEDDDDAALANAVGALPLLVADHGEAKPVGFTPGSDLPPEQQGRPTGSPGNDVLREHGALIALSAVLLLGGIVWLILALTRRAGGTARWVGKQMTE